MLEQPTSDTACPNMARIATQNNYTRQKEGCPFLLQFSNDIPPVPNHSQNIPDKRTDIVDEDAVLDLAKRSFEQGQCSQEAAKR